MMISTWNSCLEDLDYKLCGMAVKKCIMQSPYPPTIHEIRKCVLEIIKPQTQSNIDYWNEAYKMICNGIYMTTEEFENHSDIVKRYFGSINRLKQKSITENLNLEVEQSLFNQYIKNVQEENKKDALLPESFKKIVQTLANKMQIKEIGGN